MTTYDLRQLADTQLVRLLHKAWERVDKASGCITWDTHTLRIVHPGLWAVMQELLGNDWGCSWQRIVDAAS